MFIYLPWMGVLLWILHPRTTAEKNPVFLWYFAPNHWNYKNFSLIESFYEESTTPKYYKTCKTLKGFIMQSQKIFDIQLLMIFAFFLSDRAFITCKKIGSKSKVSQKTFIYYLSFATKIVMLPFLINEKRLKNIRQFSWMTRYCLFKRTWFCKGLQTHFASLLYLRFLKGSFNVFFLSIILWKGRNIHALKSL